MITLKLAKILEPEKDNLEKMVEALERLDDIIDEEKEIAEATETLGKDEEKTVGDLFSPQVQTQIRQFEKAVQRTSNRSNNSQAGGIQIENAEKRLMMPETR